jgi:3'-5' exoribonuclease
MDSHSISSLKLAATSGRVEARVSGQIEAVARKETREGKPFFEMTLTDGEAKLTLRAWSDGPAFGACERLAVGDFVAISGEFAWNGSFGIESKRWTCQPLEADERAALLAGSPEISARQAIDFNDINIAVESIGDPRLVRSPNFFSRNMASASGAPRRRATIITRGAGDLSSTSRRCCGRRWRWRRCIPIEPRPARDRGALSRCGQTLGELAAADGFIMPFDERGELLGHIAIGIELVNALWRKLLAGPEASAGTSSIHRAKMSVCTCCI